MKSNKLSIRDLITIGILNTVVIACYIVAIALACTTVIGLFASTAVAFVPLGVIYMLIVTKIRKRGTFFLCGAIMSLLGLFSGRIFTTVGFLAGGLIAELLIGSYKDFKRITLAYVGYAVSAAAGIYFPGFFLGASYLLQRGASRGMTAETANYYGEFFTIKNLLLILCLNAASAVVGACIGRIILKKHFVKAGMLEERENQYKVFPWWKAKLFSGFLFLRNKYQNPDKILADYVKPGMTTADIGCGMGYFTVPMAKITGKNGTVVAVDLQKEMLLGLKRRSEKEQCERQIIPQICNERSLGLKGWKEKFNFVLAFAVVHEVPDRDRLFREIYQALAPNGAVLMAEPQGHVSEECFRESIRIAQENGFTVESYPEIKVSRAVVLKK